jgi:signal transduction histidine kinase
MDAGQESRVSLTVEGAAVALRVPAGSAPSQVCVRANPGQLALALAYVVQNAVEATENRDGGRVAVEVTPDGNETWRLCVYDNGEGVPDDLRQRIWRTFFSTKGEWRNGLGLTIAKQIIDKHQGQIEYVDSPLGGAGFRMLLPAAPPETAT